MGVTLQTPPDTDSPNPNFPKPAHPQTAALMATPSAQPGQAVQTRQGSRWPVRGRRTELLPLSWPRGRLVGFSRSLKRFWGANRGESEGSGWAPRLWGQAAPAGRRPLSPLAFATRRCNSESGKAWPRCAGRVKARCDRPAAVCLGSLASGQGLSFGWEAHAIIHLSSADQACLLRSCPRGGGSRRWVAQAGPQSSGVLRA